jgi:hypothetical protein
MAKPAQLLLRAAVAFAYLYPPYAEIGDPTSWLAYFPQFVLQIADSLHVPHLVLLHGFGVLEVVIAVWILWGWRLYIPATAAALLLAGIVSFNLNQFDLLFRDLAIAAAALALAMDAWMRNNRPLQASQ